MRLRIVGPGRAGRSLAAALEGRGWSVVDLLGRGDDVTDAAAGVDLVVIATPDAAIAPVARAIEPRPDTVVAHLAGSLGLEVLAPHPRRAAVHPLMALPDPETGARRLRSGGWFAVAGDPVAGRIVDALGGRAFTIADDDRALYHAAAVVASNHLVALLGQAERLGRRAGVPLEALVALARGSLDDVDALGPARALTGPAARGDEETIARHRAAVGAGELAAYDALAAEARRLAADRRRGSAHEEDTGA